MFGIHELVGRWKRTDGKQLRLIPLDWSEHEGRPIVLHLPITVGRSSEAHLRLADPWVSRLHCEFCEQDGEVVVRDLESRHGVYVNERRIRQAALRQGDVLLLGVSRFRIEGEALASVATAELEEAAPHS